VEAYPFSLHFNAFAAGEGPRPTTADMKHGAFWETMHGKELRKEIPESTAPPKKKGDVVSLVGQDIPRSRLGTPQTDSVTRQ
ncbi:unnamed protein product, partial [Heterosigma akashiwo]